MCHSTLAIYCFIDDFLKASGHREDCRIAVSDAEVITVALTAMLHFGGNFERSRLVLHELGLKYIETTIGEISKLFPKKIHATNFNGFVLKIALFLFAYQVDRAFIQ